MIKNSTFQPSRLFRSTHLQTVYPSFSGRASNLPRTRERFELVDGDFVDLDWAGEEFTNQDNPRIVLILHGLCGSSSSNYVLGLQRQLLNQGVASVAMNFRGCSGEPNRLLRAYHSGETSDMNEVFQDLVIRFPTASFASVGYSLGANAMLKWLGEMGSKSPLSAAVAVSSPYDLSLSTVRINRGVSDLYQRHLVKGLVGYVESKLANYQRQNEWEKYNELRGLGSLVAAKTFVDFDELITAPLFGYDSAAHYYEQCSSLPFLPEIKTPSLLIHALDDPLVHPEAIPTADHLAAETVLELSNLGGHVGFVSGSVFKPVFWLDQRIPEFLVECL
ncbi:MAG: hydrolase [Pseudomonadales bacterium]|nr:hydrolase [Pseudomonadales bacterium]